MYKCLVTGGAGFVGSNLVDALIECGDEVVILDNLSTGKRENLNPKATFVEVDLRDLEKIKPHFVGIDYVFHTAALARVQPSIIDPVTYNDHNVNGTLNVLVAAKDAGVKKVVYSASSSAYGDQKVMPLTEDLPANAISPYGLQKYIGEEYCRLFSYVYKLPTVCLRYFNVYGPRMVLTGAYASVIGIFGRQRQAGQPLTIVGDGEQLRTYTYVQDIVKGNLFAADSDISDGRPINIGQSTEYTVNQIAAMIGGPATNLPPRIEPRRNLCDSSLAKKLLNWEPEMDLPEWIPSYKKLLNI
ncbi:MAG: NAD-dependent epimerase/dehydratase family protein [bacterium]|nr:NAD-dependent epimerase/dehydratase family protein [bacterium]